jgi:hypothetical protein
MIHFLTQMRSYPEVRAGDFKEEIDKRLSFDMGGLWLFLFSKNLQIRLSEDCLFSKNVKTQ